MKHAYLIIAHNNFAHLQKLIAALDNEFADIYIHIDKKVKRLPTLKAEKSKINLLGNRIHVIWGDITQIKVEYLLLKTAITSGVYNRFTIISGAHYPLQPIMGIQRYLESFGKSAVVQTIATSEDEIKMKLGHYHFFLTHLSSKKLLLNYLCHYLWRASLYPQRRISQCRDMSYFNGKVSQWCSLSSEAVHHILCEEKRILKNFRRTFCSDEFFIPAALKWSDIPITECHCLIFTDFGTCSPKELEITDFKRLKDSGCLFARKFTDNSSGLIDLIIKNNNAKN